MSVHIERRIKYVKYAKGCNHINRGRVVFFFNKWSQNMWISICKKYCVYCSLTSYTEIIFRLIITKYKTSYHKLIAESFMIAWSFHLKHLSKHNLKPKSYKKTMSDFIKSDFITNFCPVKDLHRFKNTNANRKKSSISTIYKNFYKVLISH